MAKISAYSAVPQVASGDLLPIVDISDLTMASTGTTKKVTASSLIPTHVIYLDQYGGDATGSTLSDSAWTAAYSAAQSALKTLTGSSVTSGVTIVLGAGIYTFSVGTVSITDTRIGLIGQGKTATVIRTTGNTGILIQARGGSEPGLPGTAPVGGFTLYGWDAGNNATGMQFGDRQYGLLFDVYFNGWNGTGSVGLQVAGTGAAVAEGVDAIGLIAVKNTVAFSFDGTLGGTSADYSRWKMHAIDNNVALQFINGAHSAGGQFHLTGTAGSGTWANPVVFVGGNSGTDAWILQNSFLLFDVEANSGSTTVKDMVLQGTAASGIQNCSGHLMFLNASGSYTAGSITTSRFSFNGGVNGSPLLGLGGSRDEHRKDLSEAISYLADGLQTITSGGTIKTTTDGRYAIIPLSAGSAVTGVILEKPSALNTPGPVNGSGLQVTCTNRSANSITFAASGTSFVADGASDVIAANHAAQFTFDPGTSLWYRT